MIVFRVGAADAEFLETEFEPSFTPNDIVNIPKYNIILKLMINGVASDPFTAQALQVDESWYTGNAEKVIKVSRERYANPMEDVEDKINRWMGAEFHDTTETVTTKPSAEKLEQPPVSSAKPAQSKILISSDFKDRMQKQAQPQVPQQNSQKPPFLKKPTSSATQSQTQSSKPAPKKKTSQDIWNKAADLEKDRHEKMAEKVSEVLSSAVEDKVKIINPGETHQL